MPFFKVIDGIVWNGRDLIPSAEPVELSEEDGATLTHARKVVPTEAPKAKGGRA